MQRGEWLLARAIRNVAVPDKRRFVVPEKAREKVTNRRRWETHLNLFLAEEFGDFR